MTYVELNDEILEKLVHLKAETGLGAMKVLSRANDELPEGLNSALINTWLNGKTQRAREDHLEFVLKAYREAIPIIPITDELRTKLNAELERTGYAPTALLNRLLPHPNGLSAALVSRWSSGQTASARGDLWEFIMDGLSAIPDTKK